jgi:hypothetical protein
MPVKCPSFNIGMTVRMTVIMTVRVRTYAYAIHNTRSDIWMFFLAQTYSRTLLFRGHCIF